MPYPFTRDEIATLKRIAFHMAAGKSMDEAIEAVRADDERLYAAIGNPEIRQAIVDDLAPKIWRASRTR